MNIRPRRKGRPRPKRQGTFLPLVLGSTGGAVLGAVAFWFFKRQAEQVVTGKADHYDTLLMEAVHASDSNSMDKAMVVVTQLGSHPGIITIAGLTAISMMRKGRRHDAWTVVISTGGGLIVNSVLKAIFQRQRPQEIFRQIKLPKSHSFPSGHSLLSAATYPIVAHHLLAGRRPLVQLAGYSLAGATVLSVGFSRVYLGVHFPSDVLGGFAAGIGWLGLTSLSHDLMDKKLTGDNRLALKVPSLAPIEEPEKLGRHV